MLGVGWELSLPQQQRTQEQEYIVYSPTHAEPGVTRCFARHCQHLNAGMAKPRVSRACVSAAVPSLETELQRHFDMLLEAITPCVAQVAASSCCQSACLEGYSKAQCLPPFARGLRQEQTVQGDAKSGPASGCIECWNEAKGYRRKWADYPHTCDEVGNRCSGCAAAVGIEQMGKNMYQ